MLRSHSQRVAASGARRRPNPPDSPPLARACLARCLADPCQHCLPRSPLPPPWSKRMPRRPAPPAASRQKPPPTIVPAGDPLPSVTPRRPACPPSAAALPPTGGRRSCHPSRRTAPDPIHRSPAIPPPTGPPPRSPALPLSRLPPPSNPAAPIPRHPQPLPPGRLACLPPPPCDRPTTRGRGVPHAQGAAVRWSRA